MASVSLGGRAESARKHLMALLESGGNERRRWYWETKLRSLSAALCDLNRRERLPFDVVIEAERAAWVMSKGQSNGVFLDELEAAIIRRMGGLRHD